MLDTFVKSFTHLKDRPKADEALPLLQRLASLVKPIMRKHGWVLPVLAEFFPESPNLLDMNSGQKILIRLRPAWAPDTFYDEEDLVHTLLHELTHNVHGPHDQQFYKYLAGLEEEYEVLKRSGYSGEGFFSKGQRLGQNVSHDLLPHLARAKALEAAEKRRKVSQVLGGPRRLGGGITNGGKSPRELAAEAAERRARDEKACGSGEEAQREADKAARESIEDKVIDLTGDSDTEVEVIKMPIPTKPPQPSQITISQPTEGRRPQAFATPMRSSNRSRSRAPPPRSSKKLITPPPSPDVALGPIKHSHSPIPPAEPWTCPRCTLINEAFAVECAVCLLIRPQTPKPTPGWVCQTCGEKGNPHQFWTCRFCGTVKADSSTSVSSI
ncbi:unnamed protein product [Somion occarium]|uniref:WLM-domain-containing protein n=1 Tax=Somion occarium TaxID=3059160 RepID=A0ABP1CKF7_9APHY